MKKSNMWIILIIIVIAVIGIALFFYNKHDSSKAPVKGTQYTNTMQNQEMDTTNTLPNATNTNNKNANEAVTNQNTNATNTNVNTNQTTLNAERTNNTKVKGVFNETLLSTFSTPIKSAPAGRLTNIRITSEKLDGYVIENGKTFSFNQVVGKPTAAEGYQEAEVIIDGKFEQAIGGGNCQVSTSIYNAALQADGVEVTERHEHGRKVNYVETGKDATVSYGSLDLKFINKTGKTLKLHVGTNDQYVTAQLFSIS